MSLKVARKSVSNTSPIRGWSFILFLSFILYGSKSNSFFPKRHKGRDNGEEKAGIDWI